MESWISAIQGGRRCYSSDRAAPNTGPLRSLAEAHYMNPVKMLTNKANPRAMAPRLRSLRECKTKPILRKAVQAQSLLLC
jgi:hypothetical protein